VIGHYGRYLVGWAVIGALLLFALTTAIPAVAGDAPAAVLPAVLVAAFTDLVVFALVLRALAADAERFPKLWGLSIAVKVLTYGAAIGVVAAGDWFPVGGFVRVLIVSFVVFAHHEIFWLLKRKPAQASGAGARPC
jgi:hypothetical protein